MNNEQNNTGQNKDKQTGQEVNFTRDNKDIKKNEQQQAKPDGMLPEDDPAVINPDELATFPKEMKADENPDLDEERKSHATNLKSSPARDGRNITRTDTTPDNDGGFM
jgi:hypothetical protein